MILLSLRSIIKILEHNQIAKCRGRGLRIILVQKTNTLCHFTSQLKDYFEFMKRAVNISFSFIRKEAAFLPFMYKYPCHIHGVIILLQYIHQTTSRTSQWLGLTFLWYLYHSEYHSYVNLSAGMIATREDLDESSSLHDGIKWTFSLEIFGKRCFDPILDYISYWMMLQTRKLLKKFGNNVEPYDMIILLFLLSG